MSQITVERDLPQSREEVFALLADIKSFHKVYALIESSPLNEGSKHIGLGAERTCHFNDGNKLYERVIAFNEGRSMTVDIYDSTMPIKSCTVRFDLKDAAEGCHLTITADYVLKFGLLGKMMDSMAVKKQFTSNLRTMIAGIAHHLATGEYIGPEFAGTPAAKGAAA